MSRHARVVLALLALLLLSGCKLLDWLRDYDWNLYTLWYYAVDVAKFHIARLGWMGYVLVPLSIWMMAFLFRPTRYLISLITIDLYRHTLSHVVANAFKLLTFWLMWFWGQIIARFRGAMTWFSNNIK